jgi:acyl carrier protein
MGQQASLWSNTRFSKVGLVTTIVQDSTTINRDAVLQIMFAVIDEVNETLPTDQQLQKSVDTHLFDKQGKLDSIGLVNFIVSLEQALADEFGVAVTLADEKAFSRQTSPFRTVDSLADYVMEHLQSAAND